MTQKTFKYPLIIKGDWQSLIPALEALGYRKESNRLVTEGEDRVLVTNSMGENGNLWSYTSGYYGYPRTTVNAKDRDLVLALAAALEGEEPHKGEAYVFRGEVSSHRFTRGSVYFLQTPSLEDTFAFSCNIPGQNDGYSGRNYENFRKATKEEIIKHFEFQKGLQALTHEFDETPHLSPKTNEEFFEALGINSPNITSEKPVETHVSVSKAFIKELYDYADDETRETLEEEFPSLFPRPTFRVGETILLFKDGTHKLMIIAGNDGINAVALLDLADGLIKSEAVEVEDIDSITEAELLEAGEEYGLTRCNYARFKS